MRLLLGPFIQSRKCMSLKFTGGLCLIRMKNDAKFEEYLLVNSKLIWGISQILIKAIENLKNLNFNELFLTKVYNVWAKKSTEELYLIALKIDANLKEKWLVISKMTSKYHIIFDWVMNLFSILSEAFCQKSVISS